MKRGPKPTPTELKVIRGNPGKRPMNENEPKFGATVVEPPEHLNDIAREEWHRISARAPRGLITDGDIQALAAYCMAYSRWVQAEERLQAMAERDPLMGGLMIRTSNGNIIQNPLVGVANKAMDSMVKYATEFGLTPSSRTRISIEKTTDANPFMTHGKRRA